MSKLENVFWYLSFQSFAEALLRNPDNKGRTTFEPCLIKTVENRGRKGAPDAWLEIYPAFIDAFDGITVGSDILILTWLHEDACDLLRFHLRSNPDEPLRGFARALG